MKKTRTWLVNDAPAESEAGAAALRALARIQSAVKGLDMNRADPASLVAQLERQQRALAALRAEARAKGLALSLEDDVANKASAAQGQVDAGIRRLADAMLGRANRLGSFLDRVQASEVERSPVAGSLIKQLNRFAEHHQELLAVGKSEAWRIARATSLQGELDAITRAARGAGIPASQEEFDAEEAETRREMQALTGDIGQLEDALKGVKPREGARFRTASAWRVQLVQMRQRLTARAKSPLPASLTRAWVAEQRGTFSVLSAEARSQGFLDPATNSEVRERLRALSEQVRRLEAELPRSRTSSVRRGIELGTRRMRRELVAMQKARGN